jgi:PAS domain S-box-containing protein
VSDRPRLAEFAAALDAVDLLCSDRDLRNVLHEVISRLAEVLDVDRGSVLLLGPNETLDVVAASDEPDLARVSVPLAQYPEVRAALAGREPLVVEDAPHHPLLGEVAQRVAARGIGAIVLFPMVVEGQARGVLILRAVDPHPKLGAEALGCGRLLAGALALALDSKRGGEVGQQTRRVSLARFDAERRLQALARFRDFFESASDGIVVLDGRGAVLYVNRAGEQITGYARDGLKGRSFSDLLIERHRAGFADTLGRIANGERVQSFDLEMQTTSGDVIVVEVATSPVRSVHDTAIISFRNVTEARALQRELKKTKEFLERLIDSAADAIVAADRQGMVLVFNRVAERIYGYRAEELVGRVSVRDLYADRGAAREIMRLLRSAQHGGHGRVESLRQEILNRDGERVPVALSAAVLYEDGREVGTVGIFNDLRERLKIEQRLQSAQERLEVTEKQALLAELAGATAHELNQPLTAILGNLELLARKIDPADPLSRPLDTMRREAERMAEIVRRIGQITRYETTPYVGETQILDLGRATGKEGGAP